MRSIINKSHEISDEKEEQHALGPGRLVSSEPEQIGIGEELREDSLSRKVFVFLNRNGDRVKLPYWDGCGWWPLRPFPGKSGPRRSKNFWSDGDSH